MVKRVGELNTNLNSTKRRSLPIDKDACVIYDILCVYLSVFMVAATKYFYVCGKGKKRAIQSPNFPKKKAAVQKKKEHHKHNGRS